MNTQYYSAQQRFRSKRIWIREEKLSMHHLKLFALKFSSSISFTLRARARVSGAFIRVQTQTFARSFASVFFNGVYGKSRLASAAAAAVAESNN